MGGEPAWNVIYEGAFAVWLGKRPSPLLIPAVTDWVADVQLFGPPVDVPLGDDWFETRLFAGSVTVKYIVVEFEFLVIVKNIE